MSIACECVNGQVSWVSECECECVKECMRVCEGGREGGSGQVCG